MKNLRGFTLIELMVTMAIAALLLFVAIPNLDAYRRNAEVTSATNTMLSALTAARGEATKRNMNAMVVPTGNAASWSAGWVVFVDVDRSGTFSNGDFTVFTQEALPGSMTLQGNGTAADTSPYVMFNASGYSIQRDGSASELTLNITRSDAADATEALQQTRRIIVARTGRARTCKPVSASDTNCAADSSF